jgi:hypothetical protein
MSQATVSRCPRNRPSRQTRTCAKATAAEVLAGSRSHSKRVMYCRTQSLMSSCSRSFHLLAQRADVKKADVKRTDLKRTDVQLADVEEAKKKGTDVIVPNYSRRPPGRGPLTLAKLVRDGHRL